MGRDSWTGGARSFVRIARIRENGILGGRGGSAGSEREPVAFEQVRETVVVGLDAVAGGDLDGLGGGLPVERAAGPDVGQFAVIDCRRCECPFLYDESRESVPVLPRAYPATAPAVPTRSLTTAFLMRSSPSSCLDIQYPTHRDTTKAMTS
jgi:hypothetical protein